MFQTRASVVKVSKVLAILIALGLVGTTPAWASIQKFMRPEEAQSTSPDKPDEAKPGAVDDKARKDIEEEEGKKPSGNQGPQYMVQAAENALADPAKAGLTLVPLAPTPDAAKAVVQARLAQVRAAVTTQVPGVTGFVKFLDDIAAGKIEVTSELVESPTAPYGIVANPANPLDQVFSHYGSKTSKTSAFKFRSAHGKPIYQLMLEDERLKAFAHELYEYYQNLAKDHPEYQDAALDAKVAAEAPSVAARDTKIKNASPDTAKGIGVAEADAEHNNARAFSRLVAGTQIAPLFVLARAATALEQAAAATDEAGKKKGYETALKELGAIRDTTLKPADLAAMSPDEAKTALTEEFGKAAAEAAAKVLDAFAADHGAALDTALAKAGAVVESANNRDTAAYIVSEGAFFEEGMGGIAAALAARLGVNILVVAPSDKQKEVVAAYNAQLQKAGVKGRLVAVDSLDVAIATLKGPNYNYTKVRYLATSAEKAKAEQLGLASDEIVIIKEAILSALKDVKGGKELIENFKEFRLSVELLKKL